MEQRWGWGLSLLNCGRFCNPGVLAWESVLDLLLLECLLQDLSQPLSPLWASVSPCT